ncbi:MAG: hypothetical protein DWP95_11465 [Proteobacteria bacterium]|nr:MAG: hypothetical protein DWP95_11465 [Pseudomonadota bacterium]
MAFVQITDVLRLKRLAGQLSPANNDNVYACTHIINGRYRSFDRASRSSDTYPRYYFMKISLKRKVFIN